MRTFLKYFVTKIITFQAKIILKKYKPKIIGVTGNIGKTSTKDAIAAVLSTNHHIRKSAKSFNSEFGVPLTILGEDTGWSNPFAWMLIIIRGFEQILWREDYPEILVLEVGADRPGDIRAISKWLHPDITVITQFAPVPVHVEFFKSREHLIQEKGYLVSATKKSGLVLYTSDDHDSHMLAKTAKAHTASYGFENWSDMKVENFDTLYERYGESDRPSGITARVTYKDTSIPMKISGVLGAGAIYAALPALYIGTLFGVNLIEGAQALEVYEKPRGRMRLLRGIKNSTIIDDTYNASPKAVEHALKTLESLDTEGKKIAVLGDMLELGAQSQSEHERIGAAAQKAAHILVTVGKRARGIAEGALTAGMDENCIFQFDKSPEAGIFVESRIEENDIILVKGSQSIRTEKVIEEVLAEADHKEDLLVRQDKEWQEK